MAFQAMQPEKAYPMTGRPVSFLATAYIEISVSPDGELWVPWFGFGPGLEQKIVPDSGFIKRKGTEGQVYIDT